MIYTFTASVWRFTPAEARHILERHKQDVSNKVVQVLASQEQIAGELGRLLAGGYGMHVACRGACELHALIRAFGGRES